MLKKPNGFTKILKVSINLNDNNFYETMGYLRFKVITDFNHLAVLEVILLRSRKYLGSKYPTSPISQPKLHQ